jgi:hypothetical protein
MVGSTIFVVHSGPTSSNDVISETGSVGKALQYILIIPIVRQKLLAYFLKELQSVLRVGVPFGKIPKKRL